MPEELSPVIREEDYLAAIAGQDVTPPDPATRKEEWLNAIAGHVDDLAGDIDDLQDIVPTPAAIDEGKVLTAGSTAGTATWQNVPQELPASLGTAGQVLTVNAGATGVEWATPSGGFIHVGACALDNMTDAPDGTTAASKYTGYYEGRINIGGSLAVVHFYFEYEDSDIDGSLLLNTLESEGLADNNVMGYTRMSTSIALAPADDDPSGNFYDLSPVSTVNVSVSPIESGGDDIITAVLPANTPFKWVKASIIS